MLSRIGALFVLLTHSAALRSLVFSAALLVFTRHVAISSRILRYIQADILRRSHPSGLLFCFLYTLGLMIATLAFMTALVLSIFGNV